MTTFEVLSVVFIWIVTGVFISYKAKWFSDWQEPEVPIFFSIALAPLFFACDVFNRIFIQKWHS